jgi:uncharacterized protein
MLCRDIDLDFIFGGKMIWYQILLRFVVIILVLVMGMGGVFFLPVMAQVTPEVTNLSNSNSKLTIAAFNVENLDPGDGNRFDRIANLIVNNLKSPDILGLTEIQDSNGKVDDAVVDANQTYNDLIQAITKAGGPTYSFIDIPPEDDQDGGEPGGNIRPGFIYQASRVTLAAGKKGSATKAVTVVNGSAGVNLSLNPGRIQPGDPAFKESRKPLVAQFLFQKQPLFVIANHFASKRGGAVNDPRREEQGKIVNDFVQQILSKAPMANIVVMGDLNDTPGSPPITRLQGNELINLTESLPKNDQFTFKFSGRLQQIDYILVSKNLKSQASPLIDIVHTNVNFPQAVSDHDPVLAQFTFDSGIATPPGGDPTPIVADGSLFPGLSDTALLDKLTADYKPKMSLSYDKARDELFGVVDNQNGSVADIYTNFTVSVGTGGSPSKIAFNRGLNTEHTWPQSKGAEFVPAESDLHHLFPARIDVNGARGNKPFADVVDNKTVVWYRNDDALKSKPTSMIDDYSELGKDRFEPRETKKGNIARAMFYFYTMYRQEADRADASYFGKQKADLCNWNKIDPPDANEIVRSQSVAKVQGNENPFVLDPTLPSRLGYCS